MSNIRSILLRHIRLDGGTQARAHVDQGAIDEYAEAMEAGASFPAVIVFEDHTTQHLWLGDGFHRVAAATKIDRKNIKADIRPGGLREARLYSASRKSNGTHGVRRSNADKRRAVEIYLEDEEWANRSSREIADEVGVSHQFVINMRSEKVSTVDTPPVEKPAPATAPDSTTWSEMERGAEEQESAFCDQFPARPGPAAPPEPPTPSAPIKAAPLPPGPDDRDSRIVQLEHLVEVKDAEIAELRRQLEEAGAQVQELVDENASLHRILDGDDLLAKFQEEVVRAQALARTTEERYRGAQNQNKALSKSAAGWKRKFETLERKTKGVPEPAPDPEIENECPYPPEVA
jgi:regulator of replication initiation timing